MRRRVLSVLACVVAVAAALGLAGAPASAQTIMLQGKVLARFTGVPVPGACVSLFDDTATEVAHTCADGVGDYRFDDTPAGSYRVRTSATGYADTWYAVHSGVDARDFASADPVHLPRQLNLGLRPAGVGTISGRLTDRGAPVAGYSVSYVDVDGNHWGNQSVRTDADGRYSFSGLWVGHYMLQYSNTPLVQYYHQKESLSDAEPVVVTDGPATVVDEELIPPGTVEATMTDAKTGAPVQRFCVVAPGSGLNQRPCTTTGLLRLELARGRYSLAFNGSPEYFGTNVGNVVVTPNATTVVTAVAEPGLAVHTTVRDAETGDPVAGTCLQTLEIGAPGIGTWDDDEGCSDANGEVTIGPLRPSTYRLLAIPGDGAHGMQWVGPNGGTGDQEQATQVTGNPGTLTTLPDIHLDPAGTVTGIVRDEQTDAPVRGVCVFPYATDWGYGDFCTGLDGRYRMTGLGPYDWPLEYADTSDTYGWQWSGGAANRLAATAVTVVAGQEVTADERLRPAGAITGLVTVADVEFSDVSVIAYDATTGDYVGPSAFGAPDFVLGNLGATTVKIFYRDMSTGAQGWYLAATSPATATPVSVQPGVTTTVADQVLTP
ncbi:MSCRAMM family protein [Actinophytocola sp.]|uniref:MSCRAMM family protein n=1 Tax=Actinophytocola sp. TaxID=1872138 RepID=UPI002ED2E39F